ncbi:MAG: glycosyltransferase [Candidatus Coatesbacteria bacterium]
MQDELFDVALEPDSPSQLGGLSRKSSATVGVVYHAIAHYREPVFRALGSQHGKNPRYHFYAGEDARDPSLKVVTTNRASSALADLGFPLTAVSNHWLLGRFLWQSGILRLAAGKQVDTIIFLGNVYFLSTWVGAVAARITGKRVLMWGHGFIRDEGGLKGLLRSCFFRLAHGQLVYHRRARDILIRKGFDPTRIWVVFNSLDYSLQRQLRDRLTDMDLKASRERLFGQSDSPVLLWIGRLTPQKKLDQLFEAAGLLRREGVAANLLLVGDGPQRKTLEDLAGRLGLAEHVRFYGACHAEREIAPLIMLSSLCIAPGEVGLTCMHALAYGVPVITHGDFDNQMPEYEAIMPGVSGDFFERDSVKDLARVIHSWLTRTDSRRARQRDCIEVIERCYNPDVQASIINAAVEGRQP